MTHVFVSGCYDIIHAGHIQFFREARALGDFLTVSFASEEVLWRHKQRRSSLPDEHKKAVLEALDCVDQVVVGAGMEHGLDFKDDFLKLRPDMLVVTEDDQYGEAKRALCAQVGAEYRILPKTPPQFTPVSTTQLVKTIRAPQEAPLRVDFAGGWLDVPRFARQGGYIVNCAISPVVTFRDWPYERNAGLGGSGAWALLNGESGVESELNLGVGWQDPAVIHETGLCVWKSGARPNLEFKRDGEMLRGKMALYWTGKQHDTPALANETRDYDAIAAAGKQARAGVAAEDIDGLASAVQLSYGVQMDEGMEPLPVCEKALAMKYCGGGFGGYALYLFSEASARDEFVAQSENHLAIEPYLRSLGGETVL